MEIQNNNYDDTKWLKDFAEDETMWVPEAYENMPAVIAFEYRRLRELAQNEDAYGVLMQIKDVYEVILKYPIILGLCVLEDGKRTNQDKETAEKKFYKKRVAKILSKEMALGDWASEGYEIKKEGLPVALSEIMEQTAVLFVRKNNLLGEYDGIVQWRNKTIGHGALRMKADSSFRREVQVLLGMLADYFKSGISELYKNVVLTQNGAPLVGISSAWIEEDDIPFSLRLTKNGSIEKTIEQIEYIFPYKHRIYFFDSYFNEITTFLDYVDGHPKTEAKKFFSCLYHELEQEKSIWEIMQSTKKHSNGEMTAEKDDLLHEMDKLSLFEPPQYIYNWFKEKLASRKKGCFMLRMGRGMGKSALTERLDGRYYERNYIGDSYITRVYHCSRNQFLGKIDFLENLNTMFLESRDKGESIKYLKGQIRIDTSKTNCNAKNVAALLNSCARHFQNYENKQLVLVIDGIDEIVDRKLFDCFPKDNDLVDGVYVFYTSRLKEELPAPVDARISRVALSSKGDEDIISNTDKRHIGILREYAKKEAKNYSNENKPNNYEPLLKLANYNFLRLRLILPVYCEGNFRNEKAFSEECNETELFGHYLDFVKKKYGKFYNIHVLPLLLCLGIFHRGLSFDELYAAVRSSNPFMLCAAINDLKCVLTVNRGNEGNIYTLSNESYKEYINTLFADEIYEYKKIFIKEMEALVSTMNIDFHWRDQLFIGETDFPSDAAAFAQGESLLSVMKKHILSFLSSDDYVENTRCKIVGIKSEFDMAYLWLLLSVKMGYRRDKENLALLSLNLLWVNKVIYEKSRRELDERIAWMWYYLIGTDAYKELLPLNAPVLNSSTFLAYCNKLIQLHKVHDTYKFLLMISKLVTVEESLMFSSAYQEGGHSLEEGTIKPQFREILQALVKYAFTAHKVEPIIEHADEIVIFYKLADVLWGAIEREKTMYHQCEEYYELENIHLNYSLNFCIPYGYFASGKLDEIVRINAILRDGCLAAFTWAKTSFDVLSNAGRSPKYISVLQPSPIPYRSESSFNDLVKALKDNDQNGYLDIVLREYHYLLWHNFGMFLGGNGIIHKETVKGKIKRRIIEYCREKYSLLLNRIDENLYNDQGINELFEEFEAANGVSLESICIFEYFMFIEYREYDDTTCLRKFKEWLDSLSDSDNKHLLSLYYSNYRIFFDERVKLGEFDELADMMKKDKIWNALAKEDDYIRDAVYYLAWLTSYSFRVKKIDDIKRFGQRCISLIQKSYEDDKIGKSNYDLLYYYDAWALCHNIFAILPYVCSEQNLPVRDPFYIFDRTLEYERLHAPSWEMSLNLITVCFNGIIMADLCNDIEKGFSYYKVAEEECKKMEMENQSVQIAKANLEILELIFTNRDKSIPNKKIIYKLKKTIPFIKRNYMIIKIHFWLAYSNFCSKFLSRNEHAAVFSGFDFRFLNHMCVRGKYYSVRHPYIDGNMLAYMSFPPRRMDYNAEGLMFNCESIFFENEDFIFRKSLWT